MNHEFNNKFKAVLLGARVILLIVQFMCIIFGDTK